MTVTKFRVGMAALLVLGIAALFAIVGRAQGPSLPPGEYDLEAGQYVFNVPELAGATDTPVPSEHDSEAWHPLTEKFGHTHGDNPADVDHIFGPLSIQEISYPWQTFKGAGPGYPPPPEPGSGDFENDFKHEGYKWDVKEQSECINRPYHDTCIMAWRIERHAVGGPVGATARVHSSYAEILICTRDMLTCGIVKVGGHQDFGCLKLWAGNANELIHVPLPDDPADCTKNNPYKHHEMIGNEQNGGTMPGTNLENVRYNWNSKGGLQKGVFFAFTTHDDWQAIDIDDPTRLEFICPDFQCVYNHSLDFTYEIGVKKSWFKNLDPDEDSIANYEGFVDRWGYVVPDCSPVGVDCIPVSVVNVPVGWAGFYQDGHRNNLTEYDTSPEGEWWIAYPN